MINILRRHSPRALLRKLAHTFLEHRNQLRLLEEFRRRRADFFSKGGAKRFTVGYDSPCLYDNNAQIPFEPHYFYHPAWACRLLREINPQRHTDISSIFTWAGCISAFWPTDYFEYQPPSVKLTGLSVNRVDLCRLPFEDNSIPSLSSMHVIEHVGLGRYGDEIDPDGDIRAARELARVLASDGHLLFVTPMAEHSSIEFNAHRIYSYDAVLNLFPELTVKEFSLVPDDHHKGLIRHADPALLIGQRFACGCFHFVKTKRN